MDAPAHWASTSSSISTSRGSSWTPAPVLVPAGDRQCQSALQPPPTFKLLSEPLLGSNGQLNRQPQRVPACLIRTLGTDSGSSASGTFRNVLISEKRFKDDFYIGQTAPSRGRAVRV